MMQKYFLILMFIISSSFGSTSKTFFSENQTQITNPLELRDPFKMPLLKRKKKNQDRYGAKFSGNTFSNIPVIDKVPLDKIKVTGVIIGEKKLAMAKIAGSSSSETFILEEGMSLGKNSAELKAILPGGIVVVEKIKNVYDQDEYLETLIPVSYE